MKVKVKAGNFVLQNESKVRRVTENTTGSSGNLIKGLGKDADHEEIIATYDKIAGYITGKEGAKVKTGCFYDFENKKPFEDPKVIYVFRVDKKVVEVPADKEVPMKAKVSQQVKKEGIEALKKEAKKDKKK